MLVPPAELNEWIDHVWHTTLEVQISGIGWHWMASVARRKLVGRRRGTLVRNWPPEWIDRAQDILADMLRGVGGPAIPLEAAGLEPGSLFACYSIKPLLESEIQAAQQLGASIEAGKQ